MRRSTQSPFFGEPLIARGARKISSANMRAVSSVSTDQRPAAATPPPPPPAGYVHCG